MSNLPKISNATDAINYIKNLNKLSKFSNSDIDSIICELNLIKKNNEMKKAPFFNLLNDDNNNIYQYNIPLTTVNCSCGHTFNTYFPIETYPPCDDCPKCNQTHYENCE